MSGVLGMDPQAQLVCGGVEAQTRQALDNLRHVLEAGGASLESVVKTTILLARIDDFQAVNHVYAECKSLYLLTFESVVLGTKHFLSKVFRRYKKPFLCFLNKYLCI